MGAVLGIPLVGALPGLVASAGSACLSGAAFFISAQAASGLTKSCNCNSSVATRVGFSIILLVNSIIAWLMLTDWAIKLVAKWSYDYIKVDCQEGKCYGVLAVHRICFALALFHVILAASLINVRSTKDKRASIQNGWWGPKVLLWLILVFVTFTIPNGFFIFYSSYLALPGASLFIIIGLVLLVDFAHSWSETCLLKWEETESSFWKWTLIGSTASLYALTIALVVLQYVFFASSGCGLNQGLITTNLLLTLIVTGLSVAPAVQEANARSGLAQAAMVCAYTAYLTTSAIANHDTDNEACNPLQSRARGARSGMVALGAVFTFLAIAYSTSRAATQSTALVGKGGASQAGPIRLPDEEEGGEMSAVKTQPKGKDSLRYQALVAAVEAGSLPPSALEESDEDEDEDTGVKNDDEKQGTKYNYVWFHIIFAMATMYVAMLLTNWNVISTTSEGGDGGDGTTPVKIGRSHVAMWMRVVSSWICLALYGWTLVAPVIMPDRFD